MDWGILDILRADGSITVSKRLIRALGTIEAIVFSELASRYCYFRDRGRLTDPGGYFFNTVPDLEDATGITRRNQDAAIKKLVAAGVIEKTVMGVPATRHFRFTRRNIRVLEALLSGVGKKGLLHLVGDSHDAVDGDAAFFVDMFAAHSPVDVPEEVREQAIRLAAEAIERGKPVVERRERYGR